MDTPAEITFKDTAASEALETLIRSRIDRLGKAHGRITRCRAVVTVPHRGGDPNPPLALAVEVSLPGSPMMVVRDEEPRGQRSGTPATMIGRVFDRLERQLKDAARIRRGDVKSHAADGTTGRVVRLFPDENYGFIEVAGSPDLYFTRNAVLDIDYDDLEVGSAVQVTIATTEGPMGPQASSVRRIGAFQTLQ